MVLVPPMAIMFQISPESNRPAGSGLPPKPPYLMEFSSVGTTEDESALLWRGENGWVIAVDSTSRPVCLLPGKSIKLEEQLSPGQLSRLSHSGLSPHPPEADRERMQQLLTEIAGPSAPTSASGSAVAPWKFLAAGAMAGIVLTVLVCLPFMLSRGESAATNSAVAQNDPSDNPPDNDQTPEPANSQPTKPNNNPAAVSKKGSETEPDSTTETPSESENTTPPLPEKIDPEDGIYIVVMREDGEQFHLGTAWAKGPQELVSSGTLVKMLTETMRDTDAKVLVVHPRTYEEFEVVSGTVSPTLDRIDREAMRVGQKLDQVQRELDFLRGKRAAGEDVDADLKPVQKEFEELGKELSDLMTQIGEYDVGTLRIKEKLPVVLKTSDQVSSAMDVTIAGVPLSLNSVNQSGSINDLRFVNAAGKTVTRPKNGVFKLVFDARLNSERIWRGSPVLDADGNVVGTYSTPLLMEADEDNPLPHNIVSVSKIR